MSGGKGGIGWFETLFFLGFVTVVDWITGVTEWMFSILSYILPDWMM